MLLAGGELPVAPEPVDLYVARETPDADRTTFALAAEARRAGLAAQLELAGRSLKGQLKHADRIGARYVAMVARSDGQTTVTLKDMESGEQRQLDPAAVIPTVLRGSRLT
jgi:histidyl-tRNA synthetase